VKRFILREPPNRDGVVHLYREDYHYLVRVRRLGPGGVFPALLPSGEEAAVRVLSTVDNILIGQCEGQGEAGAAQPGASDSDSAAAPQIYLFQGLPRGAKMDLIVRQAAEAGIAAVVPFETEYSGVKTKALGAGRLERWARIVKEARQQSGSPVPTAVLPPRNMDGLLEYWAELKKSRRRGLGLLFHQDPLDRGSFHGYLDSEPEFVALAVGPEGGFSPAETARFMEAGFRPLLMGGAILRTETAALYGAAAVKTILLEKSLWALKTAGN